MNSTGKGGRPICDPISLSIASAIAPAATGTTAALIGGSVLAAGVGGVTSAVGAYQQGQAAKQVGRNNQIMAEYAAQDAQKRGELDAQEIRRKSAQLKGTQRNMMAARGLDLSVGTAADTLEQTDFFAEADANTARYNAGREAWSMRQQGRMSAYEGRMAARNANLSAFSTLLGTGGTVADKWHTYSKG